MRERYHVDHKALRTARIHGGHSLRKLSEVSGVSFSQIAAIERGENTPTPATLRKLTEALSIPVWTVLSEEEAAS